MKNFFRALERFRVRYLLISGQATVLYGASTFSEDVDLWVDPSAQNWRRLLTALEHSSARVYKLTPPLTRRYTLGGHGFHFVLPAENGSGLPNFLDVLGVPPRVGSFGACRRRAMRFNTEWGTLPVIGVPDLVLLKKTRRLGDYPVISALVRLACRQIRSRRQWEWALHQTFEAEDLLALWRRGKPRWRRAIRGRRPAVQYLLANLQSTGLERALARLLALEIETARQQDREYWKPIITELKRLQRRHKLVAEGTPVRAAW
jgi:hypothetical protein